MNRSAIIAVIIALVVVVGVGVWYWSRSDQAPSAPTEAPTLGGQIFDKTQNPLEGQVPDTNPFKEQRNPFDVIYENPFK